MDVHGELRRYAVPGTRAPPASDSLSAARDLFRFTEDGKVGENTIYYDGAEFARQIGMLPARDSLATRQ